MKTLSRIIIAAMVVLLLGSMPESTAEARRSGHGSRVGVSLFLGPGLWAPYFYPSFYYPYYPTERPIVIQQPEVYLQPAPQAEEQQSYWYYCKDPQGYYPYVNECPSGWMKVVPSPPAPSSSAP